MVEMSTLMDRCTLFNNVCTCQPVLHIQFYLVGGKVGLMLG